MQDKISIFTHYLHINSSECKGLQISMYKIISQLDVK